MSNYDGKIEPIPTYNNQGNEHYLSSDKPDTYLWLSEENTKQAKKIERLQEQLKEANYVIKHYKYCSSGFKVDKDGSVIDKFIARSYLDKWGVK